MATIQHSNYWCTFQGCQRRGNSPLPVRKQHFDSPKGDGGAGTTKITFTKSDTGLACTTTMAVAQEVGAGPMIVRRGSEGGKGRIVSAKLKSSNCKVEATVADGRPN